MSENKMMRAYRHLLQSARDFLYKAEISAENKTWDMLAKSIDTIEEKSAELSVLSDKELHQVRTDLKADINQLAEYFNELEEGVDHFLEVDLPILEGYLADKAMTLSDPTDITVLRLRITAALESR